MQGASNAVGYAKTPPCHLWMSRTVVHRLPAGARADPPIRVIMGKLTA